MATRRAARELGVAASVVVVLHLLTVVVAVTLLGRMAPAIERIIAENVYSIEAVEEMLESVASSPAGEVAAPEAQARFRRTFERAQRNVTEPEEQPLLAVIERNADAAFRGEPVARQKLTTSLRQLGEINRAAMRRADAEASRLGRSGAWAVVLLGLVGFLVSLVVMRRIRRRLLEPLHEVQRTLAAHRLGDAHRRCAVAETSEDTRRMMEDLNEVLDDIQALRPSREIDSSRLGVGGGLRDVALWLLDREPRPIVVLGKEGNVLAASASALERLAASDGAALRARLEAVARSEPASSPPELDVVARLGGKSLVALPEAPAA
jgi:hypothetical protein